VIVLGAGVCLEIWHPRQWISYLEGRMPEFQQLFDKLSS
jgi:MraZ protein